MIIIPVVRSAKRIPSALSFSPLFSRFHLFLIKGNKRAAADEHEFPNGHDKSVQPFTKQECALVFRFKDDNFNTRLDDGSKSQAQNAWINWLGYSNGSGRRNTTIKIFWAKRKSR